MAAQHLKCKRCGSILMWGTTTCPRCGSQRIITVSDSPQKPESEGILRKLSKRFLSKSASTSTDDQYNEDPSIYGPIFKVFRQIMRRYNGNVPCRICASMSRLSLAHIENDIRKNITKQKTLESGGTKLIIMPDWKHGAVCRKCVSYFCSQCVQEALGRKSESRDQLLRVLLRHIPSDTPQELLEGDLSSTFTVLCPRCHDDFLLGVDHVTD